MKSASSTTYPDWSVHRVHHHDLLAEERERCELDVLADFAYVLQILDGWKTMLPLPDDVGQKDRQRDRSAEPDPGLEQLAAQRRGDDGNSDCGAEEEGRMLILEPKTGEDAEQDPETRVAAANDADQYQDAAHPEERFEGVHRQDAVDHQVDRGDDDSETGKSLCERAAAKLSGDRHGQRHQGDAGQNRQDPECRQRTAEKERDLGVHGDQRRAVDVPPVEVAGAVQEIELVAEIAVPEEAG
jgi:hypothetical protein